MIGGQGLPRQYTQGCGLIFMHRSYRRAFCRERYDMTDLAIIRIFLFPFSISPSHQSSPKPCMAQTLGRDVVMFSGSFITCRPTFGDRRHLLPTWRPVQEHFFSHEATNGIDMQ